MNLHLQAHQLLSITIFLVLPRIAHSNPSYTGTCGTGEFIKTIGGDGANSSGGLDSASLKLLLRGNNVDEFEFNSLTTTVLDSMTEYSIRLASSPNSESSFKGFFIRLQALEKQDISTALTGTSDQSQSSDMSCDTNVEAITHTSNSEKTSIPFELHFEDGGNYLLEVTVVISNQVGERDNWYYSSYDIRVVPPIHIYPARDSSVPSGTPSTNQSSSANTSTSPSGLISALPSISKSASPSIFSSQDPTASPNPSVSIDLNQSEAISAGSKVPISAGVHLKTTGVIFVFSFFACYFF
jgi:hypothetical protein